MRNREQINFDDGKNNKSISLQEYDLFHSIFDMVEECYIMLRVEKEGLFRYVYANSMAVSRKRKIQNWIGRTIDEVHSEEVSALLKKECERVTESKSELLSQSDWMCSHANPSTWDIALYPLKDKEHTVRYIAVNAKHSLSHALNEKELLENIQLYKSVIDHNLDGIISIDAKGKVVSCNPSSKKLLGYDEKELKDRSFFDMVNDDNLPHFKQVFRNSFKGLALDFDECSLIHKKGTSLSVYMKFVPIVVNEEVKGTYIIFRDITQQSKSLELIQYMSYHDQVTGLFNRKALLKDLEHIIYKSSKNETEAALLYIDLDRFKLFNETLGHSTGDLLLKKVGERLTFIDETFYQVYRISGDEFVILISEVERHEVTHFAAKIFTAFSIPFVLDGHEWFVTPSIGISMFPLDGRDGETLLRKADSALFQVKARGKAHFQFYNHELNEHIPAIVMLETNLRRALEKNELSLYLQPQIDLKNGLVTSFEALLRWNNEKLGFVSPADFIPIAEETGLIIPIGKWVIEEVCKMIRHWDNMGYPPLKVAVNLSPKQFLQPALIEHISCLLDKYKIDPIQLEIEITEGAMQDTTEALRTLNGLKKLGVSISVDDFGTGYSSLSYLKQFPLDTLKIDQSFIKEVLCDQKDEAIITTIIHLAQNLGLEVIAEGVESEEQADFLKKVSCQKAQGFFYSRPLPIEEIEQKYFNK
ncbi:EAL domain-containing protein [Bacillus sp. 1P06AnD]|uniref:EAL domain-containing protein n=1 Tax=Bacillus sp. 1P06AnD TaxID=3132208 RepID=UPI0039A0D6A0